MFYGDDGYSTFINWVKTLLPIAALALLSTLFMFSGKVDVTQSLPYAELNVDEIIREQRISRPYFTGTTAAGTQVALSAAFATPDPDNAQNLTISSLSARFLETDETELSILADTGNLNSRTKIAQIAGNVTLSTSTGFWAKTDALRIDMDRATAESPGPLVASSPMGRIEAGQMRVQRTAGGAQIVFTNGVSLVYKPQP